MKILLRSILFIILKTKQQVGSEMYRVRLGRVDSFDLEDPADEWIPQEVGDVAGDGWDFVGKCVAMEINEQMGE